MPQDLRTEERYLRRFRASKVEATPLLRLHVHRFLQGRERYEAVSKQVGCPAFVVGCLHQLQRNGDFEVHLHNGDPLRSRTCSAPTGRPAQPPEDGYAYSWEESAIDALLAGGCAKIADWSHMGVSLLFLETFGPQPSTGSKESRLWDGTTEAEASTSGPCERPDKARPGAAAFLKHLEDEALVDLASLPPNRELWRDYRPASLPLRFHRTLRYGDRGEDVFSTRCALIALGYLPRRRSVSDRFDGEMRQAVVSLQQQHFLKENGQIGPQVAGALSAALARLRGQSLGELKTSGAGTLDRLDILSGWAREKVRSRAVHYAEAGSFDPSGTTGGRLYGLADALFSGAAEARPGGPLPEKFAWSAQWVHHLLADCGLAVPLHPDGCTATLASLESWRAMAKSVDALRRTGKAGDIALFDWGPEGNLDRIGVVTELVDGVIASAEGGPDRSVVLHQRSLAHVGGFIDIESLAGRIEELEDRFHYTLGPRHAQEGRRAL